MQPFGVDVLRKPSLASTNPHEGKKKESSVVEIEKYQSFQALFHVLAL